MWNEILQVIIGLIILFLIYLLALRVMKSDKMLIDSSMVSQKQHMTKVLDGFVELGVFQNKMFNTVSQYAESYAPLPKSVNRKGGTQMTYVFWLNLPSLSTDAEYRNKILFFRGDRSTYTYKVNQNTVANDQAIACPLIRFGETKKHLVIEFNTLDHVKQMIEIPSDLIRIENGRWAMITLILQDSAPINDFENGLQVQCYVDKLLAVTKTFNTSLRTNQGNLYVNIDNISKGKLGNLFYYNYALSAQDIEALYAKGIPKKAHVSSTTQLAANQTQNLDTDPLRI